MANDSLTIISRKEARTVGLPRYFTGVPCRRGHLSERFTIRKQCVDCHREDQAAARAKTPEHVKAIKAASYQRHRTEVIAKVEAYTEANREKVRDRRRRHREANKDQIAIAQAAWCKANRPKLRVHERNRRDRKRGAEGKHTLADIETLYKRQKGRCANPSCVVSIRTGYHIDHVQPIVRGGSNWPQNLQLLCQPCNQSKHARDPIEWAQSLGRLL